MLINIVNLFLKAFQKISKLKNRLVNNFILNINKVYFERDIEIHGILNVRNIGNIHIGRKFSVNSGVNFNPIGGDTICNLITQTKEAVISIGNNVGISNSTIYAWAEIIISDNVIIGGGTRIWDSDFHSTNSITRMSAFDNDISSKPIHIKEYVFIGGGSIILKGVTIGENSIIAAGSVVTKNIPANCIAGGNPCVVIKSLLNA
ncbi:acyltransferase [Pedobacter agri]|uniref:acyltransferase n=1 Tax=Pedobacter agri TaxID=454586 RepID=UPI0029314976|nr:acyltransferase [Pedobacter agri]